MAVFTSDEYDEICTRAIDRGLHDTPRELMFVGVEPAYFNRLRRYPDRPDLQIRSDVNQMNNDGALGTDHFPLLRWLRNARGALSAYPDDQQYFRKMGDFAQEWQTARPAPARPGDSFPTVPASAIPDTNDEEILFESDLLPVGFLLGAARTAKAVGRITVPRFIGGRQEMLAGGKPATAAGTGWLIGRRHIVTNYHVVRGRVRGEGDPAQSDLELQMQNAVIAFNYDDETIQPATIRIAGLRAFDIGLDYAVAELAEEAGVEPLPLLDSPLALDPGHRLQVNIIQHPGGFAKQIAIRNNLAVAVDGSNLAYYTDTDKGSSGSPVCDDEWRVVALHKATTRKMGSFRYQGKDTAWINVGTPIKLIIDHLRGSQDAAVRTLWNEIGANLVTA